MKRERKKEQMRERGETKYEGSETQVVILWTEYETQQEGSKTAARSGDINRTRDRELAREMEFERKEKI